MLKFTEIPRANSGDGTQDTFELFARDFFVNLGYEILQHPDRGADGKKDLIIQETRPGISGDTKVRWLVSCKHHAHSGRSVSDTDEPNITDRLSVHGCDGFIGFYSTIPATSLSSNFEGLKNRNILIQSFDCRTIERLMLTTPKGLHLAGRYFPNSYETYTRENPKPAQLYAEAPSIECEHCGKDLLQSKNGIFVTLRKPSDPKATEYLPPLYENAYFSCKGECDHILKSKYLQDAYFIDSWADITDYLSPLSFVKKVMAWLNAMNLYNERLDTKAFEKLKQLLINSFPHVSRELTTSENERITNFLQNGLIDYL